MFTAYNDITVENLIHRSMNLISQFHHWLKINHETANFVSHVLKYKNFVEHSGNCGRK